MFLVVAHRVSHLNSSGVPSERETALVFKRMIPTSIPSQRKTLMRIIRSINSGNGEVPLSIYRLLRFRRGSSLHQTVLPHIWSTWRRSGFDLPSFFPKFTQPTSSGKSTDLFCSEFYSIDPVVCTAM